MKTLLILAAAGFALGLLLIGFDLKNSDDQFAWLGASLLSFYAAQLVGDRL